jgi:hypothetical protein
VIYTIMSDEQQRQRLKGPRPSRVAVKIAAGFVEGLDSLKHAQSHQKWAPGAVYLY